jgi:hypothetical protein
LVSFVNRPLQRRQTRHGVQGRHWRVNSILTMTNNYTLEKD